MSSNFKVRILEPLLIPLAAFVFVGGIAWGLSRLLLGTTVNGAAALAFAASVAVLVSCAAIASHGFRKPEKWAAGLSFVAIVAGGSVFAATAGIREFEAHLPEPSAVITASTATTFDQTTLTVEAAPVVVIRFQNNDPAAPHNWQLNASKEPGADVLVEPGASFFAGASRDYALNNVGAGSYFYFCAVHPATMTGTLTVE